MAAVPAPEALPGGTWNSLASLAGDPGRDGLMGTPDLIPGLSRTPVDALGCPLTYNPPPPAWIFPSPFPTSPLLPQTVLWPSTPEASPSSPARPGSRGYPENT
jgi:hypothetical protein